VSMRQVAAEIGTGAGSLYRYVDTRDDLIDLMADHVSGEYDLGAPSGDWLGDLVEVGLQAREIYRRHPWMADLAISHPVVGPNAIEVIEHVLAVLADRPVSDGDKLIAFAMLNAVVASVAQNERSPTDRLAGARRYLAHVAAEGKHPHLAALEFPSPPTEDPFPGILRRMLSVLLT
jgi:AcrR family transcriptional regulator